MVGEKKFRNVMGHFPTGVTVVTTRGEDGAPQGLTVSALTSVSLQPVLLLVCVHLEATSHDPILRGRSFAVNLLAANQTELAVQFATGVPEDRFSGLAWGESPLGNPLLSGCLGWLDCQVQDVFPGGDHSVILATVVDCFAREGEPLLFHRGELKGIGK